VIGVLGLFTVGFLAIGPSPGVSRRGRKCARGGANWVERILMNRITIIK
jgi:hypothetical protein